VPDLPSVTVIATVLNEERHLRAAVERVLAQDYQGPMDVVVALGPSRDRTDAIAAELARDPRVRTVPNPSGKTPAGLNAAIAASSGEVVVRVDGHAMLPTDYVRTAVADLAETGADNVGGIMAAEGVTPFEQAVACAMTSRLGVGNAPFHTGGEAGPAETVYLGVFRRSALERVGGYDESFQRAQDWELNYRLRTTGGTVWFDPRLRVAYRPRPDLRSLARQYFHYGRWRRVVARQHAGSVNLRYLAAPSAVLAMAAGVVLGLLGFWPGWLLPGGYAGAIALGSLVTGRRLPWRALLRLPLVYACMHVCWGVGFLTSPRRLPAQARQAAARAVPPQV
jgi:glycosyltransferase involved in cell wall biosynthesis